MPYKDCANSYRVVDGVTYEQWSDETSLDPADQYFYKPMVAKLRSEGYKAFAVRFNREGFARVFREVKS